MAQSDPHDRIAELAFSLFETRGTQHGSDWEDWFEAECMLGKTERGRHEVQGLIDDSQKVIFGNRFMKGCFRA